MNTVFSFKFQVAPLPGLANNRAFRYGDGLFETMRLEQGHIQWLASHWERLRGGMMLLELPLPARFTPEYLEDAAQELAESNGLGNSARLRLQVWRGGEGLYTPVASQTEFLLEATALTDAAVPVLKNRVFFAETVQLAASPLSPFKTVSALPYVLAGLERQRRGADELILGDNRGYVSEATASNLFWWQSGSLFTPSLASGCVAGVRREQILRRAAALQIPVAEGLYAKAELLTAEAAFTCNVLAIGLLTQIENTPLHPAALPAGLFE